MEGWEGEQIHRVWACVSGSMGKGHQGTPESNALSGPSPLGNGCSVTLSTPLAPSSQFWLQRTKA